mmetsp:Transcript_1203/g.2017  ORF Transcript_1203/g.2017 Transcript_1203/m.2017 type:complete len:294 (-) Transcript_1203:333-1214(-)
MAEPNPKRLKVDAVPASSPPLSQAFSRLDGMAVIVTGSTSGLGREIARCCVLAGCRGVAVCGRNATRGAEVVAALQNDGITCHSGCKAIFCCADVADPAGCDVIIATAIKAFGTVDGLVNSAAVCFPRGSLADTSLEAWETMLRTNLTAPFLLTQAVTRHMKEHQVRGSIVNIASIAAHGGAPFILAYSVSKAGLIALTKNNAAELRASGIRVNAINMGWCLTDAEDAGQRAEKGENWLEEADASAPVGRLLRPMDTAASVLHLLSPAATMITGSVLDVAPEFIVGMLPGGVG